MVKSLIISLILTIVIELVISITIGIRKRNDIIVIIAVNIITNPIIVFISNILKNLVISPIYWIVVAILEIVVVFVEAKIYNKVLRFNKISGFKLSLINNVISFIIGIIITIILNGRANLNIEVASAFYPSGEIINSQIYNYNLEINSTNQVYTDLIDGKADAIIVTMPSKEQEEKIKNSNLDLEFVSIYKEPLVILVNENNNIENLSIEQIQEIYNSNNSNNSNWNTYQLEKNNGSQTCFETIVKNNIINDYHYELKTMPEIITSVAEDKLAIGYTFKSYYIAQNTDNTKPILVDGIGFDQSNYPLLFDVYLIYRKDNKKISKITKNLENIQEIVKIAQ